MSLGPYEKQVLARIENSLSATDPELATMLAKFTLPRWWKIRRRGARWRPIHVYLAAAVFAVTAMMVMLGLLSAPVHPQQCAQREGLPGLTFAACAPVHPSPAARG